MSKTVECGFVSGAKASFAVVTCVDACHQAIIPESRNPLQNGCVLPRLACTESIDCEIGEYVICRYMID